MGQAEIIDLLKEMRKPVSRREIAIALGEDPNKVSVHLKKLITFKEVNWIEIDRKVAMKKYHCSRRMKLYYIR